MHKIILYFKAGSVFFLLLLSSGARAQVNTEGSHPYYFLDTQVLQKVKAAYDVGALSDNPAVKELLRKADRLLDKAPLTITSGTALPPNGDRHEYYSLARYWWPDPSKPGGLPYIRKDGRSNPEINQLPDHRLLDQMVDAVQTLSFAYFLSHKEKYAEKAMAYLRTWFTDTATRMNPDLDYAQVVKGRGKGRSFGILDARALAQVPDALQLLSASAACTPADIAAIRSWYGQYFHWLVSSRQGKEEEAAKNNHGTWYLVQAVPMSDFTGNTDLTKALLKRARTDVLKRFKPDGTEPLELARTNSLSYSVFNLTACTLLFTACDHLGENNWQYVSPGGQSLKKCIDFLVPYILQQEKWPYQQIHEYDNADAYPLYLKAAMVYNDPAYWKVVRAIRGPDQEKDPAYLLWGYFPSGETH